MILTGPGEVRGHGIVDAPIEFAHADHIARFRNQSRDVEERPFSITFPTGPRASSCEYPAAREEFSYGMMRDLWHKSAIVAQIVS